MSSGPCSSTPRADPTAPSTRRRRYEFATHVIAWSSFDSWSDRASQHVLEGHLLRETEAGDAPNCSIRLRPRSANAKIPDGLRRFEMERGYWHSAPNATYLEVEGAIIRDALARDASVEAWLPEDIRSRSTTAIAVLALALQAGLRRCGLFNLHAGALVRPSDEAGVLLVGAPGVGKSTLTLLLASQGWGYLSDDAVALELAAGQVLAHSMRSDFNVLETAIPVAHRDLPAAAVSARVETDPRKRWIQPHVAFPGAFRACVAPRVVFFPERSPHGTRLTPLSQAEAMFRLVSESPWARYDPWRGREQIRLLETLVRQVDSFVLHAGPDLVEHPRRAAEVLTVGNPSHVSV